MKFRAKKKLKLGPFYWIVTPSGVSSWGISIGRWTHNFTTGRHTIDTPGPGYLQSGGRKQSGPR